MIGSIPVRLILKTPFIRTHASKYVYEIYKCMDFQNSLLISNLSSKTNFNIPPAIDFKELRSKLHSKEILLIDVRSRRENKEEGSIPGSVNIPLSELGNTLLLSSEEFQEQIGIPKPRNNMHLVVMCLLGARGQTAQLAFIGAGYTNIRLYPGSFADWKENDGELEFQVYDNFP